MLYKHCQMDVRDSKNSSEGRDAGYSVVVI